jgi:superfamily I DNA and/or RNA helicase
MKEKAKDNEVTIIEPHHLVSSKPIASIGRSTSKFEDLLVKIITSLQKKIRTRRHSLRTIMLFSGVLVSKEKTAISKSVYKFEIPDGVKINFDDEVRFYIETNKIEAEIVSIESQFILIKCIGSFGYTINELRLDIDSTAILEKLLGRINSIKNNLNTNQNKYDITEYLIRPQTNHTESKWNKDLIADKDFNENQKKSIEVALNKHISFIWGPPGTGKTKTLSVIAYNLIKGGKKILFASNTNRAVDNGLLAVIEIFKKNNDDFSHEITRFGQTALIDSEELISIQFSNQISELKGKEELKKQKLRKLIEKYDVAQKGLEELKNIEAEYCELQNRKNNTRKELQGVFAKIDDIDEKLRQIKEGGIKTSLKLFFGTLSEEKLRKDKQILQQQGKTKKDDVETIQNDLENINSKLLPLKEREIRFNDIILEVTSEGGKQKIEDEIQKEIFIDIKDILQKKYLVGSTLAKIVMNNVFWDIQFDVLLIDEASMVDLAYLTALSTLVKEKVIVIGDPQQLAPIAERDDILRKDIFIFASDVNNVSELFEWNTKNPSFTVFLDTQYRMPEKLGTIVSKIIYNGKLKNDESVKTIKGEVLLIDTSSLHPKTEKHPNPHNSFLPYNPIHCKQIIVAVKDALSKNIPASEIGIIVPFNYSVQYIRQQFKVNNLRNLEIGNVYTFQGREKKVIIFDTVMAGVNFTVRPFDETRVGIEDVSRLLNVAISRSTRDLYVIADIKHFENYYQNQLVLKVLKEIDAASLSLDELEIFDETKINKDYEKLSMEEIDKLLNE